MNTSLKKNKIGLTLISSILVPGSGYVILGRPIRGLIMIMWMFGFGYITFHLTSAEISYIGRLSGGFAVWVVSITEVYSLAKKRWE